MKRLRKPLVVLVLLFLALQAVPVRRTNPPVTGEIAAPAPVLGILRRSCYDCHSNLTKWPWYSYVAPVSWMLIRDTERARRKMNLTEWNLYDAEQREDRIEEMGEQVEEGAMPLPLYLLAHPEKRLSEAERRALIEWSESAGEVEEPEEVEDDGRGQDQDRGDDGDRGRDREGGNRGRGRGGDGDRGGGRSGD